MADLFTQLAHTFQGGTAWALLAAALWGVLSIVLSPCHLASIPLMVGVVGGQGPVSRVRAFTLAMLFAVGILVTLAVLGVLTATAGRLLGDLGPYTNYVVATLFLVVGLQLLGVITLPWWVPGQVCSARRGALAALLLGLACGVALGPCAFAFLAPLLAVAFKAAAARPVFSFLLLASFAVGHCAVFVLTGTFTAAVQRYLDWHGRARGGVWLRAACGILVLAAGLYLIYTAP